MRAHAERFGLPSPPKRIIATGGASANDSILKEVASVFGCNVYKIQSSGKFLFDLLFPLYQYGILVMGIDIRLWNVLFRLGFNGSCFKGCSWLVVQQEGQFCSDFVHVFGQVGKDLSRLPTRRCCWRPRPRLQVWIIDEEESRNRESSRAKARAIVKVDPVFKTLGSHELLMLFLGLGFSWTFSNNPTCIYVSFSLWFTSVTYSSIFLSWKFISLFHSQHKHQI